ncbi:hypothetical protein [Tissierella sp. P1]|uniref:hypothetical protein n=1 Tax=Tissierella sp. P1 TaxID=1280483 RepID=UPI001914B0F4|nr:hypothetical protein [Tissierella sp. P1]
MEKSTKGKILIASFEVIIGTIINIYFSTYLHNLLSNTKVPSIPKFSQSIVSIVSIKQNLLLFLCFEIFVLLIAAYIITTKDKAYQSDLMKITPNIFTPVAAGQKQFGSARWMKKEEKDKAFPICKLDKSDKSIEYLIKVGDSDMNQEEGVD